MIEEFRLALRGIQYPSRNVVSVVLRTLSPQPRTNPECIVSGDGLGEMHVHKRTQNLFLTRLEKNRLQ